jgi:hypothetical protein
MRLAPIADLDGDGCEEVLVASWDNAVICLRGADGALLWYTPVGTLNGGDVWTLDATGDLDGDGLPDVVAGSFDQNVYLCSGADGHIMEQYPTGKRLYTVRSMPDVDGDGLDDLLAGTQGLTGTRGTLYCLSGASMVPVELTGFCAQAAGHGILLAWETASERDNLGFHVWRANRVSGSDGVRVTSAPIPGYGTCSSPHSYSYADSDVSGGMAYWYRLEQLDLDGRSTWYGPVEATFPIQSGLPRLELAPHPARSRVTATCWLPDGGTYSLSMFNSRGELVHTHADAAPTAGRHTSVVDCHRWAPGTYVAVLSCGAGSVSTRVVVSTR